MKILFKIIFPVVLISILMLSAIVFFQFNAVLVLIVGSSLAIVAITLTSRIFILSPITDVMDIANKVASGNLINRATVKSQDEIGVLIQVFNQMLDSIEKSQADLNVAGRRLVMEKAAIEAQIKEQTSQLKQEHSRLKASINSLGVGFFLIDPNLQLVVINPKAKRLLFFADEKDSTKVSDVDVIRFQCQMVDIGRAMVGVCDIHSFIVHSMREGKPFEAKTVSFKNRFLHIFVSPVVTIGENMVLQMIGAVVLLEDITEAKNLERSKDEFFSIASHELRTPLTAIRGNASMIKDIYGDKLPDKDVKEMVDDIHDSSIRLIQIVNDFLNVSRLEMGKIQFKKESFDILELTKVVVKESIPLAEQKSLPLQLIDFQNSPLWVTGDKDRAHEVLINLVSNAIKYTEKGEVKVEFQLKDEYVYILVSDSGRGIPLASQSLLFRKFQQASNNLLTRDTSKSTGLGLYIAKLLIEGMGGRIGLLSSEENKGSTFFMALPVATQEQISSQQTLTQTTEASHQPGVVQQAA